MERLAEGRSGKDNIVIWLESSSSSSKRALSRLAAVAEPGGGGEGGESEEPILNEQAADLTGFPNTRQTRPLENDFPL